MTLRVLEMTGYSFWVQICRSVVALYVFSWYTGPAVEAEMNAAWQKREEARRRLLRTESHNSNLRKAAPKDNELGREVRPQLDVRTSNARTAYS